MNRKKDAGSGRRGDAARKARVSLSPRRLIHPSVFILFVSVLADQAGFRILTHNLLVVVLTEWRTPMPVSATASFQILSAIARKTFACSQRSDISLPSALTIE